MTIRFPDLQVLGQRSGDVSRAQQHAQRQSEAEAAVAGAQAAVEHVKRAQRVAGLPNVSDLRVGEKMGEKNRGNQHKRRRGSAESNEDDASTGADRLPTDGSPIGRKIDLKA